MIERLFRSFPSTQALLHISGTMSSVYPSIITIFTKTLVACYFRQNNLAWLIAFLNTNDPFVKFHALGKTILEDATLTWPKMPITL